MIKAIDELLHAWAEERRRLAIQEEMGPGEIRCSLGAAIDAKGVMIPSTRHQSYTGDPRFPVTELLVNQLRYDLQRVVYEHYLLHPSAHANNARHLGYGCVKSYYNALDTAHRRLREALAERLAA